MLIDELVARLNAKRNGRGYAARCPAHDDANPSLSITKGDGGRILLKCHGGCHTETVVSALGLNMRDLFPNDTQQPGHEVTATYDYTDEDGTLLYQVVRFHPKDFRQRRPDGTGGWIWHLDDTRRVPYRLPAVRAAVAVGRRVFVCEGEKDVAAVERAGFTATCNPGGAGKWRDEYSETLRGADVVVVTDKDDAGYAHARTVARSLTGIAQRVVLVEPAVGKDASDHLAAGRTMAELMPLSLERAGRDHNDAPRVSTDVARTIGKTHGITHIRELLEEPDDAVSWIVDGLLPAGGLSVLAGKPKGGKSTLSRGIAVRVSRGEPILGRSTTKGPVIYIGLEDPRRVTKSHLRALGARADDDLYVFTGTRPVEALAWLEGELTRVDPVLVVVDTLQHLLGVSDLNDYARVVLALGPVLALVRSRRAHILLVHHAGKGERTGFDAILGSTAILGTVDTAVLLRRREDESRTVATRQREGEDLPESVLFLDARKEPQLGPTRQDHDAERVGERVLAFLGTQTEPVTRKAVEDGVEGRGEVVRDGLYRKVSDGSVTRSGAGRARDPYLFALRVSVSHHNPGHADTHPQEYSDVERAGMREH